MKDRLTFPVLFPANWKMLRVPRGEGETPPNDLVQAFPKKWRAESDFMALNHPFSLRFKGSGCHYNSSNNTGWNKIGKTAVDAELKKNIHM